MNTPSVHLFQLWSRLSFYSCTFSFSFPAQPKHGICTLRVLVSGLTATYFKPSNKLSAQSAWLTRAINTAFGAAATPQKLINEENENMLRLLEWMVPTNIVDALGKARCSVRFKPKLFIVFTLPNRSLEQGTIYEHLQILALTSKQVAN